VSDALTRREFLGHTGSALAAGTLITSARPLETPALHLKSASRPAAVSSANGIRGITRAVPMVEEGADTLDAAVEGVKIEELDPDDQSVGYGGLPNAEGIVQLDASCMHGPTRRAGGVACLEGIKTPSEIARLVLKYTDHVLLVGEGAKRFALSYGYKEEDLLTPASREAWLRWRANRSPADDWIDVPDTEQFIPRPTGTINLCIINRVGDISSVTTTSGLAWKIPGRAGDSPLVGAGQYTDNDIGAAGSTGLGEVNIMICGGFLTVEHMRRGLQPTDACLETLKRAILMTPQRLRAPNGRPKFQLNFYAVNKKGQVGSASLYPSHYAASENGKVEIRDTAYLYEGAP